ncbi:NADPH quinone reductase MdaB, partial [Pseudomonas fluorescens]
FHKTNKFLGIISLPTFLCVNVIKRPNIKGNVARYKQHLAKVFGLKA